MSLLLCGKWNGREKDSLCSLELTVEPPQRNIVRLLLVDDHAMVRQGLRALLESYGDIQVVGEASNGLEAVEMTEQLQPSVVVMDINMPEMNGIEATGKIKSSHPHTVVIGMSVNAAGENQKNHEDSWRIEIVDQRVSRRTSAHSDSRQLESHGMTGNVGSIFVPVARPQSVLTHKAYRCKREHEKGEKAAGGLFPTSC